MVGSAVVITRIIPRSPLQPRGQTFRRLHTVQFGDAEPDGRAFGYTFPHTVNVNGEMAAAKRISLPLLFSSQKSVRRGNSGAA
jgi:hypothetical protein